MSINFTGQHRKRVVNIGGGFRQNRANLLQQTQKERERRQQERQREQAAATISKALSRTLELLQFKLVLSYEWEEHNLLNGPPPLDAAVFGFNCFFADTYTRNPRAHTQLQLLHSKLIQRSSPQLSIYSKKGLLSTVAETIRHLDVLLDDDVDVLTMLLDLAMFVHSPPQIFMNARTIPLLPALTSIGSRLIENSDYAPIPQLVQVANLYASMGIMDYIHFTASPWLFGIPGFKINYNAIAYAFGKGNDLPEAFEAKLEILGGLVDKCTDFNDESFVKIVTYIVTKINFPLVTRSEADMEHDDSAQMLHNQRIISNELGSSIRKLYVRDFISAASTILNGSSLYSALFASLIALRPNLKSTFIIYMIPNVFGPSLDYILNHDVFHKFANVSEDSLFGVSEAFLEDIFVDNIDFIKYDLFLFLELLEYRLIIANDYEMFSDYGFTMEKFTALCMFLKKFAFNLIWNTRKITRAPFATTSKFNLFSELCFKLLSQVYLKDTRLHVLPKKSWLINATRLDTISLVSTIAMYDQKKKEDIDNSEEEEGVSYIESLNSDMQARLRIYLKAPFFMSFEKRVKIFQALINLDAKNMGLDSNRDLFGQFFGTRGPRRQDAVIRREHVLEDAYQSFNSIGQTFKGQLRITFVNEHGAEEGIDGGGLTKEFLTSVVAEGFDGLFVENYNHELYPNPEISLKYQRRIDSDKQLQNLNYINFMGKIIGKCLYERVLVSVTFAPFFLTKLNADYKNSFDDLRSLDPELYSSLVKLLSMPSEELENLDLTFSVDERIDGKTVPIDLIPKGSMTLVNDSNRIKFIHEMSDYKLNRLLNLQSTYFLSGLYSIISKDWLGMFNPYELQMLISGEDEVDIHDLKEHTVYGGYDVDDPNVVDFWEVVQEMKPEEKSLLVKFVTSVPRAPLLGFQALNPLFGINNAGGTAQDVARLPTSSTCVNLLRLPNYRNKVMLKEKLLYAIKSGAGFNLG